CRGQGARSEAAHPRAVRGFSGRAHPGASGSAGSKRRGPRAHLALAARSPPLAGGVTGVAGTSTPRARAGEPLRALFATRRAPRPKGFSMKLLDPKLDLVFK